MPKLIFIGRIFPSGIQITMSSPGALIETLHTTYVSTENDINAALTFRIVSSSISVECELNRFEDNPDFIALIHKPIFDLTQAVVSLVGFSTGYGLNICFESPVKPDGKSSALVLHDPRLAALCTAFRNTDPATFLNVVQIVLSDFTVCMAVNDLNEAITLTHHAGHSCFRCIERLRHSMCGYMDRKQAWIQFRDNLQVSKSYIDYITERAEMGRHGDPTFIPGPEVRELTERTWVIVNRFLEFRKRGTTPLPISEFPLR